MLEKYTVTIDFYDGVVADLKPYYERYNEMRVQAGEKIITFETYIKDMLTLGCKHFMLSNAEFLEHSATTYYKQKMNNETE